MPNHFRFDKKLPKDGQDILAFKPSSKSWASANFYASHPKSDNDNIFGNTVKFSDGALVPIITNANWDSHGCKKKDKVVFWMNLPPKPR
jgi:hypothetical protein